jgi:electron transfer flavoprotein alpha subunit
MAGDRVGVLIVAERRGEGLASITAELLGAGRAIADAMPAPLGALVLGQGVGSAAAEAAALGPDRVYIMEHPALAEYHAEVHTAALAAAAAAAAGPRVVLLGHTPIGRDLGPRAAFRLGAGLVTDCIAFAVTGGELRATKPVYGGKVLATVAWEGEGPRLATLRPKAIDPAAPQPGRSAPVLALAPPPGLGAGRVRVLERTRATAEGPRIEEAPVVVTGGRGMGSGENFKHLEELAALLGGAVGGSRAATDSGWTTSAQQVGLTGKVVKPKLYIAVGVSGAMQHMAGCQGAKTIVAVNTDARAPIFQYAHFGVVGDWARVLPAFTAKCRELLA